MRSLSTRRAPGSLRRQAAAADICHRPERLEPGKVRLIPAARGETASLFDASTTDNPAGLHCRLTSFPSFHDNGNMKADAVLAALSALSQRTRLDGFRFLVEAGPEGAVVGSIADALGVPAPTLSFHLKELSHAGLVTSRQEGRFIRYCADFAAMNGLVAYLTENCCRGQPERCAAACPPKNSVPRRKRISA